MVARSHTSTHTHHFSPITDVYVCVQKEGGGVILHTVISGLGRGCMCVSMWGMHVISHEMGLS